MKTVLTGVLTLALAVMAGCQSSSPRGGGMTRDVGFKIAVPNFSTEIQQGQTQYVTISLQRGDFFKQDVQLQINTSPGLSVNPTSVMIRASDQPDMQLTITADQNAAFGDYYVTVRGVPQTGEPTSTVFTVKVVSP